MSNHTQTKKGYEMTLHFILVFFTLEGAWFGISLTLTRFLAIKKQAVSEEKIKNNRPIRNKNCLLR
jgi:hypothetical protein